MKKSLKNSLMIAIILLMLVAIYFTINMNKNNSGMSGTPPEMMEGTPPDKNENNSEQKGDIGEFRMPPSLPDESSTNNSTTSMPLGTPPEKPNGSGPNMTSDSNTLKYVLLGLESFVIISTGMYLVLSRFNNKTFKETFKDKDKLIISGLIAIILTGGLTYLCTTFIDNTSSVPSGNNGFSNNNQSSVTYSASKEITNNEDITSGTFTSTNKDENAISVSGNIKANLSNITVSKSGDSDAGDNTSFYGNNSAILAKSGATLNVENATITTNANGANGVFSYGGSATTNNENTDGTTVNVSDSKITTTGNNSGGIMTTGGGTMNANNLEINTSGTSSAAIRTDRGGGKVTVNKGTYKTTGQGSPAIYSTAEITVNDATLIATASEGVVIEGANSVTLNNCELTDTNNKLNGHSTTYKNIFLYQSMSGDAKEGGSTFTAKNSTITTNKGDSFYVTNTTATINLHGNTIINNDSEGFFLRSKADSWGNSGSNGGNVTLNMTNQTATGNIYIDSISTLIMNMGSSSYEGSINNDNTAKSISLKLDSASTIKLTSDSYVTSLEDEDSSYNNIDFNGYKLYVNGKAINE